MAINFKKLGTLPTADSISDDDFLVVVRAANNAIPRDVKVPKSLIVSDGAPSEPLSLLDLTDVSPSPSGEPVAGQTLVYEPESGDYITTKLNLDQLGDVEISNKLGGDVLTWDEYLGKWVNAQPASDPTYGTGGIYSVNERIADVYVNTAIPLLLQHGNSLLEPGILFATNMPFRFRLNGNQMAASLGSPPVGSDLQFNILVDGVPLTDTPFQIPDGSRTTNVAQQPYAMVGEIPEDARIEVEIVSVGSSQSGNRLSVWLVGYEPPYYEG